MSLCCVISVTIKSNDAKGILDIPLPSSSDAIRNLRLAFFLCGDYLTPAQQEVLMDLLQEFASDPDYVCETFEPLVLEITFVRPILSWERNLGSAYVDHTGFEELASTIACYLPVDYVLSLTDS